MRDFWFLSPYRSSTVRPYLKLALFNCQKHVCPVVFSHNRYHHRVQRLPFGYKRSLDGPSSTRILDLRRIIHHRAMPHPTTSVLNDTSLAPPIARPPEDASPSPAAHLFHNSQENNPVPVGRAEAVVEPTVLSSPTLMTVSDS